MIGHTRNLPQFHCWVVSVAKRFCRNKAIACLELRRGLHSSPAPQPNTSFVQFHLVGSVIAGNPTDHAETTPLLQLRWMPSDTPRDPHPPRSILEWPGPRPRS